MRLERLYRLEKWAPVIFIVALGLLFYNPHTLRDWLAFTMFHAIVFTGDLLDHCRFGDKAFVESAVVFGAVSDGGKFAAQAVDYLFLASCGHSSAVLHDAHPLGTAGLSVCLRSRRTGASRRKKFAAQAVDYLFLADAVEYRIVAIKYHDTECDNAGQSPWRHEVYPASWILTDIGMFIAFHRVARKAMPAIA